MYLSLLSSFLDMLSITVSGLSWGGVQHFCMLLWLTRPLSACMWLPASVYLLALTPMGARCNTLEFDEGNRREESDLRQSFLASYQSFCVCVSRFCLLWLTPLCLATKNSPCSHSSGLSGLETQQLYCVCVCCVCCVGLYMCRHAHSLAVCTFVYWRDVAEWVSRDCMSS